jgi:hypothetical protein
VKKLICLVAELKSDVDAVPVPQFSAMVAQAETDIRTIVGALGGIEKDEAQEVIEAAEVETVAKAPKGIAFHLSTLSSWLTRPLASRLKAEKFHALAAQEDVEEIFALFEQLNNTEDAHFSLFAFDNDDDDTSDTAGDLGVQLEANKSYDELCSALGLTKNGLLPGLFNRVRHVDGHTAWNDKYAGLFVDGQENEPSPVLKPLRLHWHQVVGLHATIRKVFSSEPVEGPVPGVLIADEVGLGKTFLAASIVAWMIERRLIEEKELHRPLPPIAGM